MAKLKCNFIIKNIDLFKDDAWDLKYNGGRVSEIRFAYIDEGLAKTLENLGIKAKKIKGQKKYLVKFTKMPELVIKENEVYAKRKSEPYLILMVTDDKLSGSYDIHVQLYEFECNGNLFVKPYYEIINTHEGS